MASSDSFPLQTHGVQRQDLKVALAKAMELRALHAALLQGNTTDPTLHRIQFGASPSLSRSSNQFSAEDYPIFTPSYEEGPLPGYHYIHPENRSISKSWSGIGFEEAKDKFEVVSDTKSLNIYTNNQFSKRSLCKNQLSILPNATGIDMCKPSSMRTSSSEFAAFNTSNIFKATMFNKENDPGQNKPKNAIVSKPLNDKHKGAIFSWMFTKSKKKPKSEESPNAVESEDMSQILKDWGVLSIETLKKELIEANENKDAALTEVSEMKSSLEELQQKMVSLESYCEELKKALKNAMQGKETSKRTKLLSGGIKEGSMPVSEEVMMEGFLQIVSEARLSVKQLCITLIDHIEEDDNDLMEKLNQMSMTNKYSKGVLYHLESLINQSLYQDFENCVFQKNGCPKIFDPQQDHLDKFSSFVTLRSVSWNEVLQKGTKYYSEDFNRFCDHKMSDIVSALNWSRPWPEQLVQSFFVSAKCIWLLHLLAFSFNPPLVILRVNEDRNFDALYMEDALFDKQRAQTPAKVKIMVMPGFYVKDRVLRCKVLCRYRSVP